MVDYKRIYQAKVRDMSYKGVRTVDGPSPEAYKFLDMSEGYLKKIVAAYKKLDASDKNEMYGWANRKGYPLTADVLNHSYIV